jgi:type IV pilus assembly protein PilW
MIHAQRQRGVTIVEIMVAMAIGLVVASVVVTMFSASSRSYKVTGAMGDLQEAGRTAMGTLQRDGHGVGYRGCNSNNLNNSAPITNLITTPTGYLNDFATGLQGYEYTAGNWSPALPGAVSAPGAPVATGPSAGTDVLLMRVVVGTPVVLGANMASASVDIPVTSTAGFAAAPAGGSRAIIADCGRATVFQVTAVDGVGNTLGHASGAYNSAASLLRAFGQQDGFVMRFETHAYFVGPSVRAPATERSLWVKVDDQAPVQVVENVEDMQLLFGEDTDADFVPNLFRTADTVTNWNNVLAVQVSLLLRGAGTQDNQVITPYTYNGAAVTPADRRLRRVYSATIHLRNRTL